MTAAHVPVGKCVRLLASLLPLLLLMASCEDDFEPLAPTEMAFSIYGFLDAGADTQWVRVTPFRTSILTTPDRVDAVVTLEDLDTGQVIEMQHRVRSFIFAFFGDFRGYAHNFWTDKPISPSGRYRLTARRSDGSSSSAEVTLPHGLRDDVIVVGVNTPTVPYASGNTAYVRFDIPDGDHIVVLSVEHHRKPPSHPCTRELGEFDRTLYRFSGERPAGPGVFQSTLLSRVVVLSDPSHCVGMQPPETYHRWEARIVLSADRWPFSSGDIIGHPEEVSNVENGLGYLGGVFTKTVPLPWCGLIGQGAPEFCELAFGPETAELEVFLYTTEPLLTQPPVRLRRMGESWVRSGDSFPPGLELTGVYVGLDPPTETFPGLVPGEYRIEVGTSTVPSAFYCEERTVVLTAGERRRVDIHLIEDLRFPDEPVNARGCRE